MSETTRGRWALGYQAEDDGEPDFPHWALMERDEEGAPLSTLADCTTAELADLVRLTALAAGLVVLDRTELQRFTHHVIMLATDARRERDWLLYLDWYLRRITELALWETGLGPDPGPSPHPRDAAQEEARDAPR
jgi:hypothetical protein